MRSGELLRVLAVALTFCGGVAWADEPAPSIFGRVSAVSGVVKYRPSSGEWSDALVNEPVASGVGIRSARDAGAKLRVAGVHIAVAAASELSVARLDGDVLQIAVSQGRVGIHRDAAGAVRTVEIDLPHGAVWLGAAGEYDIAAGDESTPPRVEVFSGKVQLGGGLDTSRVAAAADDAFSQSWRTPEAGIKSSDGRLAPAIAGAAALAASGTWETDPTYDYVWYPKEVAADWAPYRDGAWRFLPPWGWTWVDAAPWGFAPSHYGRWAHIDDRWGWIPDAANAEPDFGPAQVAFLGTAPIGLSCPGGAGPAIAWFPLAPGETVGDGNDYNYLNRRFATAVPRAVFTGGLPVAAATIDLPRQRFADAPVILGPLGVVPAGAGSAAAAKPAIVAAAAPAAHAERRPFIVRLTEAPARPVRKRMAFAAATPAHPHPAASTGARNSTHNRQHLAAARRGV
jgi:hypothetical protein